MRPQTDPFSAPPDLMRHELQSQRNILRAEAPVRFVTVTLAYAIAAVFLPHALVAVFAAINLVAEIVVASLLRDVETLLHSKSRRRVMLACTFAHEICFAVPPAMIWHLDDPLAKAFAVGMTAANMMHIALVRSIHLPMGISGAVAIWLVVLTSNTIYWLGSGMWLSFAVSTLCALLGLSYFTSALLSNNRLHRETYAGWAEALSANAAKTRFLAQMSHELRTPLNAILGMGHAELARQTDPVSRDRLELLVDAAAGLGVLLDDILDMAAVEAGRLPIRPVPLDPRAEIAATVGLFRPQADAAGLTLELRCAPELPAAALADGRRLRQCLSNILSNALKYTTQGGITVQASRDAAGLLCIEVSDSGQGVPPELRDAIFEPFQRGTGPQAGTGLGLTISRALARRMGGDLVILPAERGARFCLTLALAPADASEIAPQAAAPALRLERCQVLVVDDIATNRLVAATYLRMMGADPVEADGGEAALRLVAQSVPAAILLDMNMPGLDGIATLRRLRAMGGAAGRIPVIAMTADATETHRIRYMDAGMDGYVAKPLTPDRLAAALRPHFAPGPPAATPTGSQGTSAVG